MAYGFEKLEIWQAGVELLLKVYELTRGFPQSERFGLCDQLKRSANSVVANIAEAMGRYYKKDKIKTLYISRGEIEETKSHLLVAGRLGYVNRDKVERLIEGYNLLAKRLNSFIGKIRMTG